MRSRTLKSIKHWPVSLRPEPGELLYSWASRIAAIYQLHPSELFAPEHEDFDVGCLIHHANSTTLQRFGRCTGVAVHALHRMTCWGAFPVDQQEWWTSRYDSIGFAFPQQLWFSKSAVQLCPLCLRDDFRSSVQFIRLHWQSAAMTLCQTHRVPMQTGCVVCGSMDLLICQRIPDGRFRFLCPAVTCCSPQEAGGWAGDRPRAEALAVLLAFERLLL